MWFLTVLSWLAKLTRGTDFDDKLVVDLRVYFRHHPQLAGRIFTLIKDAMKNGFDFNDPEFTKVALELVFDVIETQAPSDNLGSNKL